MVVSVFLIVVVGLLYGMMFIFVMIIVFGFVVNVIEWIFILNLYVYILELYFMEYCLVGSGLVYGFGCFFNIFGFLFVGFIVIKFGYISVFLFIGGCWFLCFVLLIFFGLKINV